MPYIILCSYCQIRFEGSECKRLNFSYHVAFASVFFLLALTSLIQLTMCIHAGSVKTFEIEKLAKLDENYCHF